MLSKAVAEHTQDTLRQLHHLAFSGRNWQLELPACLSLPTSSHSGLPGPTLEMNQEGSSHGKQNGVRKMPNQHLQMALIRKPRSSGKESPELCPVSPEICAAQRHGVSVLSAFTWRGQNENTVATSMLSQQGEEEVSSPGGLG